MKNSRECRCYYYPGAESVDNPGSRNCCYLPPVSSNAFRHSYYANNFPVFHGYYQENTHQHQSIQNQNQEMRRARSRNSFDNRMPLMETGTPGSRVQNHVDGLQFSDENQPSRHCWQPSFRSSRDVRNLSFHHYHSHSQHPSADTIPSLALPDLNHDMNGSILPIISPTTDNSVVPDRVSYKGRFNPGKPPSFPPQSTSSPTTELRANDIVCGRGAPTLFHEGNKKFRELILQYQSTYLFSKRPDKPRVAWNLLEIVTSHGGRFVRRVKGNHSNSRDEGVRSSCHGWEPLNERQAYDKICQSLREGAPELKRRILLRATREIQSQRAAER